MKSLIVTILIAGLVYAQGFSQDSHVYRNAVGVRVGLSSGFTYQHQIDQFRGYKGMLSFRDGGVQITALLESYRPLYLKFTDRMYYYTGMGVHIGYTTHQPQKGLLVNPLRYSSRYGRFTPVIGMDAIVGLEIRLKRAPLAFSLDAKPFFELFGQNIFRLSLFDIGLTMKYTF